MSAYERLLQERLRAARRREALEEMEKGTLVEIVLRLQDQLQTTREGSRHMFDDGIAEGRRRAKAEYVDAGLVKADLPTLSEGVER